MKVEVGGRNQHTMRKKPGDDGGIKHGYAGKVSLSDFCLGVRGWGVRMMDYLLTSLHMSLPFLALKKISEQIYFLYFSYESYHQVSVIIFKLKKQFDSVNSQNVNTCFLSCSLNIEQ